MVTGHRIHSYIRGLRWCAKESPIAQNRYKSATVTGKAKGSSPRRMRTNNHKTAPILAINLPFERQLLKRSYVASMPSIRAWRLLFIGAESDTSFANEARGARWT